jgi:gas vesicle protein
LFWLAIAATLFVYALGPMLTRQLSDPKAPSWKPILGQKVHDVGDSAVDTASSVTNRTANIAQELSSKTMDTVSSATDRVAGAAQDVKNNTVDTASSATAYTADTAKI